MVNQEVYSGRVYAGKEIELNPAQKAIADAKSKVCAEFEKVCQTDKSLKRMVKEMHNIFDKLSQDIEEIQQ